MNEDSDECLEYTDTEEIIFRMLINCSLWKMNMNLLQVQYDLLVHKGLLHTPGQRLTNIYQHYQFQETFNTEVYLPNV